MRLITGFIHRKLGFAKAAEDHRISICENRQGNAFQFRSNWVIADETICMTGSVY
jgi:hypothetical protein